METGPRRENLASLIEEEIILSYDKNIERRPGGTGGKHEQASVDKPSYTIRPNTPPPPPKKK